MIELNAGQSIEMEFGGSAKVHKVLGSGGQGIVYLVDFGGVNYALKWYDVNKIKNPQAFRKNIERNINDGAPSNKFLWPKYLTKPMPDNDGFGYLMDLRPEGYDSFVDILNMYKLDVDALTGRARKIRVQFKSLFSLITAVINIVNAFRQLHRAGKSYQDLNDGGFFINVDNGDVLVCDCDNIAPDGYNFGIGGKPGYMAPEIVRGIAKPDVQTDKYSLAVVFVFDPNNNTNRPVRGIHDNVIKFWGIYPEYIRKAFTYTFTVGIHEPSKRIIENQWQKLFVRLRDEIISCQCGRTTFASSFASNQDNSAYKCQKCGAEFPTLAFSNCNYRVPLYIGKKFFACETVAGSDDFQKVTGEVVENKLKKGMMGIKNLSGNTWNVKMPDGKIYKIENGRGFPIWHGLSIDFGGVTAHI